MPTPATTVHRLPERAHYDLADIHAILDAGFLCHVGFTTDLGPVVIPTLCARDGDRVLLHGSHAAGFIKNGRGGQRVCVTVTLLDGLVLARSAFHHSVNYRSVMLFGNATVIEDLEEKRVALEALMRHIVPERDTRVRQPNEKELKTTAVLSIPIDEASAKVRGHGVVDDEEDMQHPVWAGVLPLRTTAGEPIADGTPLAELEPGVLDRIRRMHP